MAAPMKARVATMRTSQSLEEAKKCTFHFFGQPYRSLPQIMDIYNLNTIVTNSQLCSVVAPQFRKHVDATNPKNDIWPLVSVRGFCSIVSAPQTDLLISPVKLLAKQAANAAKRVQGKRENLIQRVTNMYNEDKGMIVLAGDVFDVPIRKDIVHRVVRWQLAKRQQGTHSTKTISEVSGTGRKPYKQKGTGQARHGSLRGPQFRHGATMHGPKPRSHAIKLQKKVRRLGLKIALSARVAEGKLMIFDNFDLPSHKTKEIVKYVSQLNNCKKFLLVDGGPIHQNLCLATQNLHYVNVLPSIGLNVYSILQHDTLVMTIDAVNRIVERMHTPINR